MKISSENTVADAKEQRRQGELGFTMVEIAIAIGVIGFALVAIIGILPAGMGVQKENREDTLITQDAPYFLEAIRNGCPPSSTNFGGANHGLDFLTNYVESITFSNYVNGAFNFLTVYSNFTSGSNIIGLLSTPQPLYASPYTNISTTAIVRALSGPASQQSGANTATAFRYQMTVEVVPFINIAPDSTNYVYYQSLPNPDPTWVALCSNRWLETTWTTSTPGNGALVYNLFEIRLHFSWPVLPASAGYVVGPGRQTYRSMVAARLFPSSILLPDGQVETNWFFQPFSYTNSVPPPPFNNL